jgi:hypothetical protein
MIKCPKCSYALVFLESRRRYKCSICSKLYYPKKLENEDFRKKHLRLRKETKKEHLKQMKRDHNELQKLKMWLHRLFTGYQDKRTKKVRTEKKTWQDWKRQKEDLYCIQNLRKKHQYLAEVYCECGEESLFIA